MNITRRAITMTLILAMLWPHQLIAVAAQNRAGVAPGSADYAEVIEALRDEIPAARIDPDALVDALDYEPAEAIAFVSAQIRFEQYPGLLRGPRGTLLSRSGNALDQSVLLAKLLRDAGVDARVVRGRLTPADAERLLDRMLQSPAGAQALDLARVEELLAGTDHPDVRPWLDPGAPPVAAITTVERMAALIDAALDEQADFGPAPAALIEEARDYFWVERRDAAADPWTAVHPAFGDQDAPTAEVVEYFADSVPSSLAHRFRVQVHLERLERDELMTQALTPAWERPAANLTGRSVSVMTNPIDLSVASDDPDFATKLAPALEAVTLFVPLIDGQVLPGSYGFDLNGVPYSMDAVGGDAFGMTPLFRNVGDRFDRAAAALDGLDQDEAPERLRHLTAVWIDYTLVSPSGDERGFRRFLVDRIGPDARARRAVDATALGSAKPHEVMAGEHLVLATGALPGELVLSEYIGWMSARAELAGKRSGGLALRDYSRALERVSGPEALRLFSLTRRFDASLPGEAGGSFRSAPTLLALHWSMADARRMRVSTDLMSNDRRARAWRDVESARADILRRGVWETFAERFAFADLDAGAAADSPFDMLEDRALRLAALPAGQPVEDTALTMSADALVRLGEDAARHWVVAPLGVRPADEAWWRVDPLNGSVIGVLPDGRGAVKVEYKILLGLIAVVGVTLAARAIGECTALLFEEARVCIGSLMNVVTGDTAEPYVNEHLSECFWDQFPPWADVPEPRCRCGGLGEPECPDWQQPF